MPRKRTATQRRNTFIETLRQLRVAIDKAAYLQGCRAADPTKHDTDTVRLRERAAQNRAFDLEVQCVQQFNAAMRAASRARSTPSRRTSA